MSKEKETKQGHCPECDGIDLEYGVMDILEDGVFYPVSCPDCGHQTEEHYNLEFVGFTENF